MSSALTTLLSRLAFDGGWTAHGMSQYANQLEGKLAAIKIKVQSLRDSNFERNGYHETDTNAPVFSRHNPEGYDEALGDVQEFLETLKIADFLDGGVLLGSMRCHKCGADATIWVRK